MVPHASVRVLDEREIRSLIGPAEALAECREAFARLARREAELPEVLALEIREHRGEVHAKGGYLHGAPYFSIKVASGFYDNPRRGLPVSSGAVWVFEADTGRLAAILLDNAFLTELRTGAAGALAAELLARQEARTVGVLGSGSQARYQLEALLQVRRPAGVRVWSPTRANAERYAREMQQRFGLPVGVARSAEEVVRPADLLVTATPARAAIVRADWVGPGTHITAMGADLPGKQELEPALLARAKVVADRLAQCLTQGEIHHAVAAGTLRPEQVHAELGEIAAGMKPGRTSDAEITIADLTGVGVQDAAVAAFVTQRAVAAGIGRMLDLDGPAV